MDLCFVLSKSALGRKQCLLTSVIFRIKDLSFSRLNMVLIYGTYLASLEVLNPRSFLSFYFCDTLFFIRMLFFFRTRLNTFTFLPILG